MQLRIVSSGILALVLLAVPAAASTGPGYQGIDVSSAQHVSNASIHWKALKKAGYRFAAIKVSEGTYYVNPYFHSDVAGATRAGLAVFPYVFANPHDSGGSAEADYAMANIGARYPARMLPLVLDVEKDPYTRQDHVNGCYGLNKKRMVSWIASFAARAKTLTGRKPMIYTNPTWWRACTGDSRAFRGDPLWIADYGSGPPDAPRAWPRWTIWQYTDKAHVQGVARRGGTDLDYAPRSLSTLLRPTHRHHHTARKSSSRGHRHPSGYRYPSGYRHAPKYARRAPAHHRAYTYHRARGLPARLAGLGKRP